MEKGKDVLLNLKLEARSHWFLARLTAEYRNQVLPAAEEEHPNKHKLAKIQARLEEKQQKTREFGVPTMQFNN